MIDTREQVLVVGGGISGIVCALELERLGVTVALVEKEPSLGGLAASFCCKASETCNRCFACLAERKLKELGDRSRIAQFTGAGIAGITGGPGDWRVALRQDGRERELGTTAVVVAAGIDPYDASGKGEYGYGVIANVVTARDLEEMLRRRGTVLRPSDGRPPRTIAFFQCVGSRDESIGHLYCSQVCCATALRLIRSIRHTHPDVEVSFFYMDIQPAGASFPALLAACREDPGVRFIRSIPSRVYENPATGDLRVRVADPGQGQVVEAPFDMVVLSVGMVLKQEARGLADLIGLALNEDGFLAVPPADRGLFVTGACTGPKDIDRCVTQAKATVGEVYRYLQGRQ